SCRHDRYRSLTKRRLDLFPERSRLIPALAPVVVARIVAGVVAVDLRWRGLRGTDGIGGWKAVDQTGFQTGMSLLVRQGGIAGVGRVFVRRGGIEFRSHF